MKYEHKVYAMAGGIRVDPDTGEWVEVDDIYSEACNRSAALLAKSMIETMRQLEDAKTLQSAPPSLHSMPKNKITMGILVAAK